MLTLIGKKTSSRFKEIQSLLDKLSLSYTMKYTSDSPFIQEGSIQYRSNDEIEKFLLDLENELKSWYYCAV